MEPICSERTAVTSRELLTLASSDKIHTSYRGGGEWEVMSGSVLFLSKEEWWGPPARARYSLFVPLGDECRRAPCSCCLEPLGCFEKESGTSRVQELQIISLDHSAPAPLASSLLLPRAFLEAASQPWRRQDKSGL